MKKVMIVLGEIFAVLLLAMPERALAAAAGAMTLWYTSVAPAMFPFLAVLPLLTCPEACRAYDFLLGRFVGPLLKIPGRMASAIVIAMISGSPAGSIAAARIAGNGGMERKYLLRCGLAFCGLGPMFLLSGVGVAMFGSERIGRVLVISQAAAQWITAAVLRGSFNYETEISACGELPAEEHPIRAAAMQLLQVCGYMALFSVIAGMISAAFEGIPAKLLLGLLDFPGGAAMIAGLSWPLKLRVCTVAVLMGFGGVCIACQNMSALGKNGVKWGQYLSARLFCAVCSGAVAWLICPAETAQGSLECFGAGRRIYEFSTGSALIAAIPAAAAFVSSSFLNIQKARENRFEKCRKAQDVVDRMHI